MKAVGGRRHEALLATARSLWRAERIDAIGPALDAILSADAVSAAPAPILARAYELYGRLELRRFRRPIAARHFRDALDALAWSPRPEPQLHAALLHALLAIAIETLDLRLLERVRSEIDETDWDDPTLYGHLRAVQPLLALGALLLGESTAAWEIGFALRIDSPQGLQQIVADVTAAEVARSAGDAWTPAQLIRKAASLGAHVAWSETGAAGARALLTLIAEVVGAAPDAARALLAAYESLPARQSWARADHSSDLTPLEFVARAAIHGAEGNVRGQVAHLRSAIARWHEVGNAYGELRASLTLAQVTGDTAALARADELTRLVPCSWLRDRCATLAKRARDVLTLSPAEHRIMLALLEGLSGAEIAAKFGRSKNTIRNQTKRVFEVMGVRTRSELVARCAALGLSTPDKRP